jgi:hypothetical protein
MKTLIANGICSPPTDQSVAPWPPQGKLNSRCHAECAVSPRKCRTGDNNPASRTNHSGRILDGPWFPLKRHGIGGRSAPRWPRFPHRGLLGIDGDGCVDEEARRRLIGGVAIAGGAKAARPAAGAIRFRRVLAATIRRIATAASVRRARHSTVSSGVTHGEDSTPWAASSPPRSVPTLRVTRGAARHSRHTSAPSRPPDACRHTRPQKHPSHHRK